MAHRPPHASQSKKPLARVGLAGAGMVVAFLVAPLPCRADSPTADALFREGRKAAAAADYATAAARFAESQRLDPAAGTLLNLALAEEKLGRLAAALDHAGEAGAGLDAKDSRQGLVKALKARLEPRVPRLRIKLADGAPPGTVVLRDDVELGAAALALELPTEPGQHRIVVKSPGRRDAVFTVVAEERAVRTVDVAPGAAEPAAEPSLPKDKVVVDPPASTGSPLPSSPLGAAPSRRTAGWVTLGASGILLAGSSALGVLVLQKKAVVEAHCDPSRRCDATGLEAGDAGRTLSWGATGLFAVGVVGAGVATYLLVRTETPATGAAGRWTFAAGLSSVAVSGRF